MTHPFSVAVAGLGTVGGGVLKLLRDNADLSPRAPAARSPSPRFPRATAPRTAASR